MKWKLYVAILNAAQGKSYIYEIILGTRFTSCYNKNRNLSVYYKYNSLFGIIFLWNF